MAEQFGILVEMRASCQPPKVNLNAFLCVSVPLWQVFALYGRWHHEFRFTRLFCPPSVSLIDRRGGLGYNRLPELRKVPVTGEQPSILFHFRISSQHNWRKQHA